MTQPNQKIARSFEDMKGGLDLLIGGLHDLKATIEQLETDTLNWADSKVDHVWPQVDNTPEEEPAAETEPPTAAVEPAVEVSMEDVRKLLAAAARDGRGKQVKQVLNNAGLDRLKDATPQDLPGLYEQARRLADAA